MTKPRLKPLPILALWSLIALLMSWTAAVHAGPLYSVQLVRRDHDNITVASDSKTDPPALITGSSVTSDGTNSFHMSFYQAQSDRLALALHGAAATYSQYAVGKEWWETARWRWDDVVFSCQDGRSQVDASLRIKVKGFASGFSYTYTIARSGEVSLYLGHPGTTPLNQGTWRAASNNNAPDNTCLTSPPYTCTPTSPGPVSTGVFAGSTGDTLDRTVNYSLGASPVGAPVVVDPQFTLVLSTRNEYITGNFAPSGGGGISLPTDGPVFDLPAECTCNSEQIGIIDNRIAYRISSSAGAGGTISPSGTVVVNHDGSQSFTIAPDPCNTVTDVLVDGVSLGAVTSYAFSSVTAPHTIEARFAPVPPSTIAATAGAGGAISPSGAISVACGAGQAFTIMPAACHHITDVLVDGVSVGAVSSYAFSDVTAGHTVSASFAPDAFTITASAGSGGTVAPGGSTSVSCDGGQSFTITAADCHHILDVLVDGASVGAVSSYTFADVTVGHTISASFALDAFSIVASAGSGGAISPSGSIPANCGSDQAFSITPDVGYSVADVLVDGVSVGAPGSFGLADIRANHTIAASFSTSAAPLAVAINAPASGAIFPVNTSVSFQGSFSGDLPGSTHTATWTIGGLAVPGVVSEGARTIDAAYTFSAPGVYMVQLGVSSSSGASATTSEVGGLSAMVVIYDPNGGFVTGGGWINSPSGAYLQSPLMTGKASFGFESKYRQGAAVPTGQTTFQFKVASLNFSSDSYEWLVVTNAKALYKGIGKVNGSGSYGFMLSAIDGALLGQGTSDKFRIKIWDLNDGDALVYDNQLGAADTASAATAIGGGSIVIHKGNGGGPPASREQAREEARPLAFAFRGLKPNPFTETARAQFDLPEEAAVRLAIFDLRGRRVAQPVDAIFGPGSHEAAWNGRDSEGHVLDAGIYFVRIEARMRVTGREQTATIKVVRAR